jgi:hypothetical protein
MSSPPTKNPHDLLVERIKTNCVIIWGTSDEHEYDLELRNNKDEAEAEDECNSGDGDKGSESYQIIVRKDYSRALGPKLVSTDVYETAEEAWDALDEELGDMAVGKRLKEKSADVESRGG